MKCCLYMLLVLTTATVVLSWNPGCITKPVGFGYKTTGGAGGKTVKPKDINELKKYLASKEKLIIDLVKVYDFTNSEGTATSKGCYFQKCGNGFQESIARLGTCDGKPQITVKYYKAGLTELVISSYKTIMSSNGKGAIKGKGIRMQNAQHVIVRDITISDINPLIIWAGDAIVFDNVENVWIHRVTVRNIGRQHIASMQRKNTGITISSCLFDGKTAHAALCNGKHYWTWIFFGTHDEITLINNHVLDCSGRTPHTGGWAKSKNFIHMVGNLMDINPQTGIEPRKGAVILAEGNKFINYARCIDPQAKGGNLAMVNDAKSAAVCKKYFGQNCLVNKLQKSQTKAWFDESVLQLFSKLDKKAIASARNAVCAL